MALNATPLMPPLQQQLWDKTLDAPLAFGTVYFFEDTDRRQPKDVYTLVGSGPGSYTYVSLGSFLNLSGIGTYIDQNNFNIPVYLWPFEGTPNDAVPSQKAQNYYIEVYSSTGVFQFPIQNWPGVQDGDQPSGQAFNITQNIISNPQFTDVNFSTAATAVSPVAFSTTGTNTATEIAPNWSVVTTGSGSFSVWQVQVSDDTAPGNPAYALGITSSGYSQPIQLRQRIFAPRLLSKQFVSGTFIAQSPGSQYTLSMNYIPSITGTIQQICTGTTATAGFTIIANQNPALITDPGSGTGYIDITIVIPVNATIQLSCVQICSTNDTTPITYLQESPERQIDHLFHYFQPQLNYKPLKSYLVGWDFPLNPAQAKGFNSFIPSGTSSYIWDQTILFQNTAGNISVSRSAGGTLVLTNSDASNMTQCALIQYLALPEITPILETDLSVNVFSFANMTGINGNVSLWYTTNSSLPPINSSQSLVTALDTTGHPSSVVSGWFEIPFPTNGVNAGRANFTFNTTQNADHPFSYWPNQLQTNIPNVATFFAIVVGTSLLPPSALSFGSISLVPGRIPTRPAPQTESQVLQECQYYYEKSYAYSVVPGSVNVGTGSLNGYLTAEMLADVSGSGPFTTRLISRQFGFSYKTPKYYNTNFGVCNLYSLAGTLGNVTGNIYLNGALSGGQFNIVVGGGSPNWNGFIGSTSASFLPQNVNVLGSTSGTGFPETFIQYHYTVDARLGVI